jgi:predicted alpha-1,6-mannanase (GH76 family)
MEDIKTVAPLVVQALQQWYGADPYALQHGLYSYRNPSLAVRWREWENERGFTRNFMNGLVSITRQRDRVQDTTCWWISANAVTAVTDYMLVTGDRSYVTPVVENTFTKAPGAHRPVKAHGISALPFLPPRRPFYSGFINGYYDDEGWWALAWIAAFDLTGDEGYLTAARDIFQDMTGAWDNLWGGGIYWGKHNGQPDTAGASAVPHGWKGPYKNAIANALFTAVAAALSVRYRQRDPSGTDHQHYLEWALRGWKWFSSSHPDGVAMTNKASLVNDSPNRDGVNDNTESIWSYNQGVILSGLCDLAELTGDETYLGCAEKIADAFISNPWYVVPRSRKQVGPVSPPNASGIIDGILHEYNDCNDDGSGPVSGGAMPGIGTTVFKGIFIRNLARLQVKTSKTSYGQFIMANARSAISHMNEHHQFGSNWAAGVDQADFVRQTSGLDLVNAALLVIKNDPSYAAAGPPG